MSTAELELPGLPNYTNGLDHAPLYSRHPSPLPDNRSYSAPPSGHFVKASKTGNLSLELYGQEHGISIPVYDRGSTVRGQISVHKQESVSSIEVKIDGHLRLTEVGGSGHHTYRIISEKLIQWNKDDLSLCPTTFDFAFPLPRDYMSGGVEYSLPPTFDMHLSGVPGFRAEVSYSITVDATKSKHSLFGNHTVVSTPLHYFPRIRPSRPLPSPMPSSLFSSISNGGASDDWEVVESSMRSRSAHTGALQTKLIIPAGRTFSVQHPIPFKLRVSGSALSLATFLPCSPTAYPAGSRPPDTRKGLTRVYMVRQIAVDVQNMQQTSVKTDIFKVIPAGEAVFRRLGDGTDWAAWEGEIHLERSTIGKIGSFKAGGLWVRDSIVLSIIPPNPSNSPLMELRCSTPVRIVTEPHSSASRSASDLDEGYPDEKADYPFLA